MHAKADFGMRLVGAPLADPRNVTSRKFMDDSVKQLSEFLASTGYMGEVTPARLLSPTSASFRSVMVHLLKMLDASYVVGPPDKFADEVQSVFKALRCGHPGSLLLSSCSHPDHPRARCRYPFPISKTAITAAGAQQSWPTLLSAIMWFVSLLKVGRARLGGASSPRPPGPHPPPRSRAVRRARHSGGGGRRRGGPQGRRGRRRQQQPRVRAAISWAGLRALHAGEGRRARSDQVVDGGGFRRAARLARGRKQSRRRAQRGAAART